MILARPLSGTLEEVTKLGKMSLDSCFVPQAGKEYFIANDMEFFRETGNEIVPLHPRTAGDCHQHYKCYFLSHILAQIHHVLGLEDWRHPQNYACGLWLTSLKCVQFCAAVSLDGISSPCWWGLWSTYTPLKTLVYNLRNCSPEVGLRGTLLQTCRYPPFGL